VRGPAPMPKRRAASSAPATSSKGRRGPTASRPTGPKKALQKALQKAPQKALRRQNSFAPIMAQDDGNGAAPSPHTLICGTFPSEVSFEAHKKKTGGYFANPTNAFWWTFADAFGHARALPAPASSGGGGGSGSSTQGDGGATPGPPKSIRPLHTAPLRSYGEQLRELTQRGFVLWDVMQSCKRQGSVDANIERASVVPNDIRGLCARNPSIKRICLASGKSTAQYFKRHFKSWLEQSQPAALQLADNQATRDVFGTKGFEHLVPPSGGGGGSDDDDNGSGDRVAVTLCVMYSVSGAACNPKVPGGTYNLRDINYHNRNS
jgi:G:T/U-mismatch repair DNA glycosylase